MSVKFKKILIFILLADVFAESLSETTPQKEFREDAENQKTTDQEENGGWDLFSYIEQRPNDTVPMLLKEVGQVLKIFLTRLEKEPEDQISNRQEKGSPEDEEQPMTEGTQFRTEEQKIENEKVADMWQDGPSILISDKQIPDKQEKEPLDLQFDSDRLLMSSTITNSETKKPEGMPSMNDGKSAELKTEDLEIKNKKVAEIEEDKTSIIPFEEQIEHPPKKESYGLQTDSNLLMSDATAESKPEKPKIKNEEPISSIDTPEDYILNSEEEKSVDLQTDLDGEHPMSDGTSTKSKTDDPEMKEEAKTEKSLHSILTPEDKFALKPLALKTNQDEEKGTELESENIPVTKKEEIVEEKLTNILGKRSPKPKANSGKATSTAEEKVSGVIKLTTEHEHQGNQTKKAEDDPKMPAKELDDKTKKPINIEKTPKNIEKGNKRNRNKTSTLAPITSKLTESPTILPITTTNTPAKGEDSPKLTAKEMKKTSSLTQSLTTSELTESSTIFPITTQNDPEVPAEDNPEEPAEDEELDDETNVEPPNVVMTKAKESKISSLTQSLTTSKITESSTILPTATNAPAIKVDSPKLIAKETNKTSNSTQSFNLYGVGKLTELPLINNKPLNVKKVNLPPKFRQDNETTTNLAFKFNPNLFILILNFLICLEFI